MLASGRAGLGWLVMAALVLGAAACGRQEPAGISSRTEPETVSVAASTNVYGSVVSAVGGDRVSVTSFINNASADPLEYESTAADAAAVADAKLVVVNGDGYDTFMSQLIDADGGATVIDVAELSGLKRTGDGEGEFNEHVFYDLGTIQRLADAVAAELARLSPSDAATFTANAAAFKDEVGMLRAQLAEIKAEHAGARVAVTEPLAGYLVQEAGLRDVTPDEFAEAVEEGDDPASTVLVQMLELFSEQDPVEVLILNTQTQTAVTDQVRQAAGSAGVPVVEMSETLTTPDYLTWMGGQISALAKALDAS